MTPLSAFLLAYRMYASSLHNAPGIFYSPSPRPTALGA
jgi:hypothetical protein